MKMYTSLSQLLYSRQCKSTTKTGLLDFLLLKLCKLLYLGMFIFSFSFVMKSLKAYKHVCPHTKCVNLVLNKVTS